jgi:multiple antibiotic resistance protein
MAQGYLLNPTQIFTVLFVMLGPLKMLGTFAKSTETLSLPDLKKVSLISAGVASIALIAGGYLGSGILASWGISVPILQLGSGLIFLLMGLLMIIVPKKEAPQALTDATGATGARVALSMIVTPYGMAAVIGLLAVSKDSSRTFVVLGLLVLVLALDLISMLYIRKLMGKTGMIIMQIAGGVLSVLQVTLALQIIVTAYQVMNS